MADWQINCENLSQRGKQLLYSDTLADCAFVMSSAQNAITIKSHKFFLAIASPVFERMFYGSTPENDDPIPISDLQPEVFKALLEFVYTDSVMINSCDEACKLYYAAKKYILPHLITKCIDYLILNLNPVNVCSAYEFAKMFDLQTLMDKCLVIFQKQTKAILDSSTFEECQIETVIKIFEQEVIDVSELELFGAAVKYSGALRAQQDIAEKYKKNLSTITCTTNTPPETALKVSSSGLSITNAIQKIRFLTFSSKDFAEGPARSNLLTSAEALSILVKITSPNSGHLMPDGFTTSIITRHMGRTLRFFMRSPTVNGAAGVNANEGQPKGRKRPSKSSAAAINMSKKKRKNSTTEESEPEEEFGEEEEEEEVEEEEKNGFDGNKSD